MQCFGCNNLHILYPYITILSQTLFKLARQPSACLRIPIELVLMLKMIFTCVKIVAHPRLMPHCGIIWVHITRFRHENNSTPGVLIEEIQYAKQKHLGCKKVRGQSEATLQTGRYDWLCHLATFFIPIN